MTRSILWFVPLALAMIPSLSAATEELDRERLDELLASGTFCGILDWKDGWMNVALQLTPILTYDADRGGMVKFYQPWCGQYVRRDPEGLEILRLFV